MFLSRKLDLIHITVFYAAFFTLKIACAITARISCNFLYLVSFCFYLKNRDNCFISLPLNTLKVTFKKENAGNLFSIVRIIIRSLVTGFT